MNKQIAAQPGSACWCTLVRLPSRTLHTARSIEPAGRMPNVRLGSRTNERFAKAATPSQPTAEISRVSRQRDEMIDVSHAR